MSFFKSKLAGQVEELAELKESLASLQAQFDSLNETYASVQDENKNLTELLATTQSEFSRVSEENKELQSKVEGLTQEIAETTVEAVEFEERASFKASEIAASLGVDPVEVEESEVEATDVISTFKSLKGKELAEFYQKNRDQITKNLKG